GRLGRCRAQRRVIGQPEVVVRAQQEHLAAVYGDPAVLRTVHLSQRTCQARGLTASQLAREEVFRLHGSSTLRRAYPQCRRSVAPSMKSCMYPSFLLALALRTRMEKGTRRDFQ